MKKITFIAVLLLTQPDLCHAERIVDGIQILTTLDELVDPKHSAVIVVDLQNDWCSTEGGCVRTDKERPSKPEESEVATAWKEQMESVRKFLDAAREKGVLVCYAEYIHKNELGQMLVAGPDLWCHRNSEDIALQVAGSWESKTFGDIAPKEGDIVIRKHHGNSFYGTALNDLLKERGIRSVLLCGTGSLACVLHTAIGAQERGYYPVYVRDCVDNQRPELLEWVDDWLPMYESKDIVASWEKALKENTAGSGTRDDKQ